MKSPGLDLEALRALAVGVAYRMVGSRTEAEDLAQEAIVRVQAAATGEDLRSPEAFTTTVTTRLAIDHLRSARVQRESYHGPWLPEPVLGDVPPGPADAAELADSVSFAMLVVLEKLQPDERAAFVLHDVFAFRHREVARTLGRTEASSRQLVSRARRKLAEERPRSRVAPDEHRRVLERFIDAARTGDVDELLAVLADDAVHVSDGGANRRAARRPIVGRKMVSRFIAAVGPKIDATGITSVETVNGQLGYVVRVDGQVDLAATIDVEDGLVRAVHWVLNPDKLAWIDRHAGTFDPGADLHP